MKMILNKSIKDEKGQALILVMILLLVGGLIVTPLLSFMGTGLIAGRVFEEKAADLYAADAGVEDGIWQIKYDHLDDKFGGAYDPYDYGTPYPYPTPLDVNDRDVKVTIENIWIPKDLAAPSPPSLAEHVIEGVGGNPPKVIITGSVPTASTFKIKIQYYPEVGEDLRISTLGIWLPPGFTYGDEDFEIGDPDPSNLNGSGISYTLSIQSHASGQAVIWDFGSGAYFDGSIQVPPEPSFPGVDPAKEPMVSEITFQFDGPAGQNPEAVSWIDTNVDLLGTGGITYTWDADTKVYKITSEAHRDITEPPDTTIDAYTAKSEIREFGGAIAGDYRAIGNSLMISLDNSGSNYKWKDTLLEWSDATVGDIPDDAEVTAAYLYWSGWFEEGMETIIFEDDCAVLDNGNWDYGTDWHESGSYTAFYVQNTYTGNEVLTMIPSQPLGSYSGDVTISWRNWTWDRWAQENDDRFQYAFYNDSGWGDWNTAFYGDFGTSPQTFSTAIPQDYLTDSFKVRFRVQRFGGSDEYCYIDNIEIVESLLAADETCIFEIDGSPVYFDAGVPTQGAGEITADISQVINNLDYGNPHGYSYSSFKDVTDLVRTFSDEGDDGNYPGNATYTVGDVDADDDKNDEWAYAGWSLILIYASAETQGHQLYLYDDFLYCNHDTNLDFDQDGEPGGTISGFLVPDPVAGEVNAAKITCFVGEGDDWYDGDYLALNDTKLWDGTEAESLNDVWNCQSIGMTAEGVDIDTFYVTWASDLLEPGDTSAQIDMWTNIDIWNFVYLIVSFRSEVTAGGTLTYLVS